MTKRVRLPRGSPLLDIVSLGRRSMSQSRCLSRLEIEHIRRTVNRAPEVMVKVLSHASHSAKAVRRHLDYISRKGSLALETDDGQHLKGKVGKTLLDDWALELDELRQHSSLTASFGRKPPKIVHKMIFSMPPGTPPEKVLLAVQRFAASEFWGKHRYVLVLHTDEPHPHVHLVVQAISVRGERLNIDKATLRRWRSEFAEQLRQIGVSANATERAVRGQYAKTPRDGAYRAALRGESQSLRHWLQRDATTSAGSLAQNSSRAVSSFQARDKLIIGWQNVAVQLSRTGEHRLAREVDLFVYQLRSPSFGPKALPLSLKAHSSSRSGELERTR